MKFKSLIIIFFFYITFSFNFTLAESNSICTQSPDFLSNYFSTIISILNKIKNSSQPQNTGIKALGNKIVDSGLGGPAIAALFGIEGFLTNFFPSFVIITHQYYIVRDWAKLINFKKYITKTYLDIAKKGALEDKIPPNLKTYIQQISKNNIYIIHIPSNISTYSDLISFIRANQQDIENIYFSVIVGKNLGKPYGKYPTNGVHIAELYLSLEEIYKPNGKEVICEKTIKDFLEQITNIKQILSDKSKNTIKRFECNYERLASALQGKAYNGKCGNVKLITGWNIGLKVKSSVQGMGKILINATTNNDGKIIDTTKFDTSGLKKLWIGTINFLTGIENKIKNISELIKIQHQLQSTIPASNIEMEKFTKKINSITNEIKSQSKQASTILISTNTNGFTYDITLLFPKLSYYIWKNICTIDSKYKGCEDSSKKGNLNYPVNGIYQNLVKTCENQSPFIGRCKYIGF